MENSANSQLKRGLVDLFVLLALYQKSLYPSEIIEILKTSGINMPEGTLYPLLNRLKNDQHLTYEWEESTGGPPRKYFQITDSGKVLIQERLDALKEIVTSVKQICQFNSINF